MFDNVKHRDVFHFFEEISAIPRGSGNEAGIASYLESFAKERSLSCVRDAANNVFITKEASAGRENDPPVMLQEHVDMVCEAAPGTEHDFLRDPIKLIEKDGILSADGTTLGADDGVAVAIMLALLDDNALSLPLIECLFTTSEEVGLDGMKAFDFSLVRSRLLINLDSADEGVATVSCAGGVRTDVMIGFEPGEGNDGEFYTLEVSGLAGGHSGEDIALRRVSAVSAAAEVLRFIAAVSPVRLSSMTGGGKDNAIPRDCRAVFCVKKGADLSSALAKAERVVRGHLTDVDKRLEIKLVPADPVPVANAESTGRLIDFFSVLRPGPVEWTGNREGMVETSYNVGVVNADCQGAKITLSSRSSESAALDDMELRLSAAARLAGGTARHRNRYPGWAYREGTKLQRIYSDVFEKQYGRKPVITGIHAGLECGIVSDAIPEMDIISLGPVIRDLHSPSETLEIPTLDRLYGVVCGMLEEIR
ncbi:MAG: beta-Ala-His dipeptidase [Clostridia bacterium]|nr:beta-Ala-His dipeptidase [Clostridia bacterium]